MRVERGLHRARGRNGVSKPPDQQARTQQTALCDRPGADAARVIQQRMRRCTARVPVAHSRETALRAVGWVQSREGRWLTQRTRPGYLRTMCSPLRSAHCPVAFRTLFACCLSHRCSATAVCAGEDSERSGQLTAAWRSSSLGLPQWSSLFPARPHPRVCTAVCTWSMHSGLCVRRSVRWRAVLQRQPTTL